MRDGFAVLGVVDATRAEGERAITGTVPRVVVRGGARIDRPSFSTNRIIPSTWYQAMISSNAGRSLPRSNGAVRRTRRFVRRVDARGPSSRPLAGRPRSVTLRYVPLAGSLAPRTLSVPFRAGVASVRQSATREIGVGSKSLARMFNAARLS
jgi:hypothetical protein